MESAGTEHANRHAGASARAAWILAPLLLAFVALRLFGMATFAPHNDEVIYAQIAGIIASDWENNKFIYQSGRLNYDYKEPLQHWANSLTVGMAQDPLPGCRIWSVLLGAIGLFFLHRWVARVWSESAAHLTAAMVVVSEYYFYFDSIAINEAFLYGLGISFIYFAYDFLEKSHWISGALSLLLLLGVLLTKGSGIQWAVPAFILPVIVIARRSGDGFPAPARFARSMIAMMLRLGVIVLLARWLHSVVIPAEYLAIREKKLSSRYVYGFDQLLDFPIDGWLKSLSFFGREVLWNEFSVFLVPVIALIVGVAIALFRTDRRAFTCYLAIVAIYLASFAPLLLVARIHFIRYFGTGLYFLYAALAIALLYSFERLAPRMRTTCAAASIVAVLGWKLWASWIPLVEWGQTDLSFAETPAGWANGSGVMALVDAVEELEPGVMVTDPQWGHPTTTVEIYGYRYPQMKFRPLAKNWTEDPSKSARKLMGRGEPKVYFLFDARLPGARGSIDRLLANEKLCGDKQVFQKRYKDRVMRDSNLTICTARL